MFGRRALLIGAPLGVLTSGLGGCVSAAREDGASTDGRPGTGARPVEILEESAGERVVRHAAGTSRIPAEPSRIWALSDADELLSLGVVPVAHAINDGNFPDYLAEPLAGVPWIPNVYGAHLPSMEAVVAVRPDLIFTRSASGRTQLQLSRIAPVVVLQDHDEHYRQRVLDVGAIIGRAAIARARVAWYDAKVAAAREVLHQVAPGCSIAVLRVYPTSYRLHGGDHHVDPVLYGDLAVARPRLIVERTWTSATSPEALLHLDADYLIIAADVQPGSDRSLAQLLQHPVWSRVPAVRNDRVLLIPKYRHWADAGILGRARSIDDVVRAVSPGSIEAVNAHAEATWLRAAEA